MKNKIFLLLLIVLLVTGHAIAGLAAPEAPKVIIFGTHTVGTGGHRLVSLVAEAIIEKEGIKVRCVPAGADVARTLMARQGEAHTAALNSLSGWCIQEGLFEYSEMDWGPQPIRYLWIPQHVGATMAVRGDSDIHKMEDLKGKRVATMPGSPSPQLMNEALLAFGGLTWDDVVPVPHSGPAAAYDAVIKNRIDGTFFNVAGGKAHELAAMPCGIRYIEVPATNEEGWKRLREVAPVMSPRQSTVGATLSEKNPAWTMSQGYPNFIAWADLDENTAYYIAKSLHQSYEVYAQKHKSLKIDWTIDKCISLFDYDVVPFHKGAIRYLKEIGRWTPEREEKNQMRIAHQAKLKELWEDAVKEAKQKGIKTDKFPDSWMKKRAAAGFWAVKK